MPKIDRWSGFMGIKVGALPLPAYGFLAALLIAFAAGDGVRKFDGIAMTLITIAVGASTFVELGRRVPAVRNIGLDAILTVFVPSFLVYVNWIHPSTIERT